MAILESLVRQRELQNATDIDLDRTDIEVLLALYSGVRDDVSTDAAGQSGVPPRSPSSPVAAELRSSVTGSP